MGRPSGRLFVRKFKAQRYAATHAKAQATTHAGN